MEYLIVEQIRLPYNKKNDIKRTYRIKKHLRLHERVEKMSERRVEKMSEIESVKKDQSFL